MRKDVKVGLASGAVLLAVVIVYVSSLNKSPTSKGTGATLANSSTTGGGNRATTPRRTGDVTVSVDTDPVRPTTPGPDALATAAPSEPDWAKLLESGAPPALMTRTPAPGEANKPSESSRTNDLFADSTSLVTSVDQSVPTATGSGEASAARSNDVTAPTLIASTTTLPPALATGRTVAVAGPNPSIRPTPATRTYVVKENESFSSIARDVYGNAHYYPHIMRANPTLNPNKVRAGAVINLPDPATVKPSEAAMSTAITNSGATASTGSTARPVVTLSANEYRVGQNENLYRIAVKLYGSPKRMQEIYELNKAKIGDDPSKLKVGSVLKLPATPKAQS